MKSAHEVYQALYHGAMIFAEEAQPIFDRNGWSWALGKLNEAGKPVLSVPDVYDIASVVISLAHSALLSVVEESSFTDFAAVSGGRIQVRITCYDGNWNGSVELVACELRADSYKVAELMAKLKTGTGPGEKQP